MGIDRNMNLANHYLNQINQYINENGFEDLNAADVYNLAYLELNNRTDDDEYNEHINMTKVIEYFNYAADHGEVNAYNALAVLYMNGQ